MEESTYTLNNEEYILIETKDQHILKSKNKSINGFYRTLRFTKDKEIHNDSVKFISDFIAREIV